jgi:cytochrome c
MRITLLLCFCLLLGACGDVRRVPPVPGGNAENGRLLLRQFGCGSCHEIPGVAAAQGKVGPPLAGIASRAYIAGVLPNTPERMTAFIRHPQQADPRTAMPDLGVNEHHARDMVTYLYTLK